MNIAIAATPVDAIVVGSGATGGWAAKRLTEAGLRVLMLEAGNHVSIEEFASHRELWSGQSHVITSIPDRPIQRMCYACRGNSYKWFVNDCENPYTQLKPFHWIRARVLGGRTLSWGRQCYRLSDLDFKAASRDGVGIDWPISYDDLVPYYEIVERYIGISGTQEKLAHVPDSIFMPAMKLGAAENLLRNVARTKFNRTVTIGRSATLTRDHNGRKACSYCGPCEHGCATTSYFASPWTTIADALATGKLTIITNAVASRIITRDGKATGVTYVDGHTRERYDVHGRVIVLCASTLESTRLLLTSGICNSSGTLGRYLMDHVSHGGAMGTLPICDPPSAHRPERRPNCFYIARFRNVRDVTTNGFIRGYNFQGYSHAFDEYSHGGNSFRRQITGTQIRLELRGETLPNPNNYVALDTAHMDAWGIPTLKIHCEWSENERRMWVDGCHQACEMLAAAGARNIEPLGPISVPGSCIHEVGTARMGNDPKTSVLNSFCQAHELANVFVTDGAAWVSSGCQSPTLTMMALTVRACDYIIREYRKELI